MNRKQVQKIYKAKKLGRGYKPSRFKRPPSAKLVRKMVAKRIGRKILKKIQLSQ